MEDSVMDRKKTIHYVEVSAREKRDIFQLAAVRRSMRHLDHASLLMAEETMAISKRFMEVGPNRASLMHVGYESLQGGGNNCAEKIYEDETFSISRFNAYVARIRGDHPIGFVFMILGSVGELGFYFVKMSREGVDIIALSSFLAALLIMIFNATHSFPRAFKPRKKPLTKTLDIDRISLSGINYLRVKGLEAVAKAQARSAAENGKRSVDPDSDLLAFKNRAVRTIEWECYTAHFLLGAVPTVCASALACYRSVQRGDLLLSVLAAGCVWSRTGEQGKSKQAKKERRACHRALPLFTLDSHYTPPCQ